MWLFCFTAVFTETNQFTSSSGNRGVKRGSNNSSRFGLHSKNKRKQRLLCLFFFPKELNLQIADQKTFFFFHKGIFVPVFLSVARKGEIKRKETFFLICHHQNVEHSLNRKNMFKCCYILYLDFLFSILNLNSVHYSTFLPVTNSLSE